MKNLARPLYDIRFFKGVNNHDAPEKIIPAGQKSYLTVGINIDYDNMGMISRRKGYRSASYSGSGIHSLWANDRVALFVEGQNLKLLNPDYSSSVIRSAVGPARMAYADGAGRAYYSNEKVIGYVEEGTGHLLPTPTMTFRIPMPPGHLIEWFNGRLYVARERQIIASDPMYPGQTHEQEGFKKFAGRITMMRGIKETGLLVSDSFGVYLLQGLDWKDFTLNKLADFPAIFGSDVKIDGNKFDKGYPGEMVLWLSKNGICAAGKGGFFQAITLDYYHPATVSEGSAILREANGHFQYLVTQGEPSTTGPIDTQVSEEDE